MELAVRALMPKDAGAARALAAEHFAGTRYLGRLLEQLDSALQFEDPEYMALLAFSPSEESLLGLVLFGAVAGARSVVKVHGVIGAESQVLCRLLAAVRQACEGSGERLIVCELPDDLPFHRAAEALGISGYREEGRVPDFVRDGVALRLVVWRA